LVTVCFSFGAVNFWLIVRGFQLNSEGALEESNHVTAEGSTT
jgi:hypothetical protein